MLSKKDFSSSNKEKNKESKQWCVENFKAGVKIKKKGEEEKG